MLCFVKPLTSIYLVMPPPGQNDCHSLVIHRLTRPRVIVPSDLTAKAQVLKLS